MAWPTDLDNYFVEGCLNLVRKQCYATVHPFFFFEELQKRMQSKTNVHVAEKDLRRKFKNLREMWGRYQIEKQNSRIRSYTGHEYQLDLRRYKPILQNEEQFDEIFATCLEHQNKRLNAYHCNNIMSSGTSGSTNGGKRSIDESFSRQVRQKSTEVTPQSSQNGMTIDSAVQELASNGIDGTHCAIANVVVNDIQNLCTYSQMTTLQQKVEFLLTALILRYNPQATVEAMANNSGAQPGQST